MNTPHRLQQKISHKHTRNIILMCAVLTLLLAGLRVYADINKQVNYQGKLTDTSGLAVADSTYNFTFRLYTASTGGSAVWTENRQVPTVDGLFSVMLGASTTLDGVDFNQTLYLGVEVESDGEMTPRKILGAVPAAFEASSLGGATSTQYLRSDIPDEIDVTSASTGLSIYQRGSGDILNLFDDSTEVFTVFDGGNIGIGTTSPFAKLSVAGDGYFDGTLTASGFIATSTISAPYFTATSASATSTFAGGAVFATGGGNVGIGTSNPTAALHIDSGSNPAASILLQGTLPAVDYFDDDSVQSSTNPVWRTRANNSGYYAIQKNDSDFGFSNFETVFVADADGEIGIGTETPTNALLHINSANTIGSIESPTLANAALRITDSGAEGYFDANSWFTDNSLILSTTNNEEIKFGTDNIERLRIAGTGNVGIGTTTPNYRLDVNSGTTNDVAQFESSDPSAIIHITDSSTTNTAALQRRGDELYLVPDGGDVGVNEAAPEAQFHVTGTEVTNANYLPTNTLIVEDTEGTMEFIAADTGNFGASLLLTNIDTTHATRDSWALLSKATSSANRFAISYGTTNDINNYGSSAEKFVIDTSGNVGIGTTAPESRLMIGDATVSTTNQIIFGKAETASQIFLPVIQQRSDLSPGISNDLALGARSADGGILFFTGATDAGSGTYGGTLGTSDNALRMVIDSSGNVGIGTTSPFAKLSVAGDIYADGTLTVGGLNSTSTISAPNFVATDASATSTFPNISATQLLLGGDYITDFTGTGLSVSGGTLNFDGSPSSLALAEGNVFVGDPSGQASATSTLYISQTGNVGIGDASPTYLLTVGDSDLFGVSSSGNVVFSNSGNKTLGIAAETGGGEGKDLSIFAGTAIGPIANGGDLFLYGGGTDSGSEGNVILAHDGSSVIGNVGIGTVSPSEQLELGNGGRLQLNDDTGARTTTLEHLSGSNFKLDTSSGGIELFTAGTRKWFVGGSQNARFENTGLQIHSGTGTNQAGISSGSLYVENNIGIGTTSPFATLSVAGDGYFDGGVTVSTLTATSTVTGASFAATDASATSTLPNISATQLLLGGDYITDFTGTGLSVSGGTLNFDGSPSSLALPEGNVFVGDPSGQASATSTLYISQAGDVGIGTNGPAGTFHVVSESDVYFDRYANNVDLKLRRANNTISSPSVVTSGDALGALKFDGWDGSDFETAATILGQVDGAVSAGIIPGRLVFRTTDSTGTEQERLRITSTGLVGIGTSTPTGLLTVATSTDNPFLFVDDATGNVGIGTDSPEYQLHTSANAMISGGVIYFDENTNKYIDASGSHMQFAAGNHRYQFDAASGVAAASINPDGASYVSGSFAAGTTSPYALLSVEADGSNDNLFVIGDSGSTTLFKVDGAGNVGVGTDVPIDNLSPTFTVSGGSPAFILEDTDLSDTADGRLVRLQNVGGDLLFYESGRSGSGTTGTEELLRVTSTGDVGVGTDPSSDFHLYRNDTGTGVSTGLTVEQDGTGDALLHFLLTGSERFIVGIDNSDSDKFKISDSSALGTNDFLTIVPVTGYTGIGTSTPGSDLHVESSVTADDVFEVTSTLGSQLFAVRETSGNDGIVRFFDNTANRTVEILSDATPTFRLGNDIVGSDYAEFTYTGASGNLTLSMVGTGASDFILQNDGDIILVDGTGANVGIATSSPYAQLSVEADGSNENLFVVGDQGSTTLFKVDGAGNVGIGTDSPDTNFHVLGPDGTGGAPSLSSDVVGLFQNNGNVGDEAIVTVLAGASGSSRLNFADVNAQGIGGIRYVHSSDKMQFSTGGSTQMYIDSSGNVGIGTSSPFAKLSVAGDIYADGTLTVGGLTSTSTISAPNFAATDGSATSTFAGGLTVDGTEFVVDPDARRVGIGTDSPAGSLGVDVSGQTVGIDVSGNHSLFSSNDAYGIRMNASFGEFSGSPSLYGIYSAPQTDGFILNSATNNYAFYGAPTGGTTDWGIYLTGEDRNYFSGNVGIGTSTPAGLLTVATSTDDPFLFVDNTTGNVGIGTDSPSALLGITGGSGGTDYLRFVDDNNNWVFESSSGVDRLDLSEGGVGIVASFVSGGSVGIGTTTPNGILHVSSGNSGDAVFYLEADEDNNEENDNPAIIFRQDGGEDKGFVRLNGDGGSYTSGALSNALLLGSTVNGSALQLLTQDIPRLSILNTGNVGIGTTSPESLLVISAETSGDAVLTLEADTDNNNEDDNPGIVFKQDGGSNTAYVGLEGSPGATFASSLNNALLLGTDGAESVQLAANGSVALTVDSSSNIGIGTSSPSTALHVVGPDGVGTVPTLDADAIALFQNNASVGDSAFVNILGGSSGNSYLQFSDENSAGIGQIRYNHGNNSLNFNAGGTLRLSLDTTSYFDTNLGIATSSPYAQLSVEADGSNDNLFVVGDQGSTTLFKVDGSGNVGIGTDSPDSRLDLYTSGATNTLTLNTDASRDNVLDFKEADVSYFRILHEGSAGSSPNNLFKIQAADGSDGTIDVDALTVTQAGNIGIRTDSPNAPLHILNGAGTDLDVALRLIKEVDGSGSATGIHLGAVAAGTAKAGIFFENTGIGSGRGNLIFANNADSDTSDVDISDARLVIDYQGNTGIGTTSPFAKLSVAGDIYADGTLTVGGLTSTSTISAPNFVATDASATSTFAGGLTVDSTDFVVDPDAGRVGIGTNSPSATLDIQRPNSSPTALTISNSGTALLTEDAYIIKADASNYEFTGTTYSLYGVYSAPGTTIDLFANAENNYAFYGAPTGGTTDWGIYVTGEDRNYFSGSVGIGTTTPSAKLVVTDGDSAGAFHSETVLGIENNTHAALSILTPNTQVGRIYFGDPEDNRVGRVQYDHSANDLGLWVAGAEALTIDSSGDVGIGTDTPSSPLHVYQNDSIINNTGGFKLEQDGTGDTFTHYLLTGATNWITGVDNSDADKFKIGAPASVGTDVFSSGNALTIQKTGEIGIGTESPDALLDIVGIESGSDESNTFVEKTFTDSGGVGFGFVADEYAEYVDFNISGTVESDVIDPADQYAYGRFLDFDSTSSITGSQSAQYLYGDFIDLDYTGSNPDEIHQYGYYSDIGGNLGTGGVTDKTAFRAQVGGTADTSYGYYASVSGATTNWAGYFALGDFYVADNVGIGDTTPTYKLDVAGDARFTGLVDAAYFNATSTAATSTFAGGVHLNGFCVSGRTRLRRRRKKADGTYVEEDVSLFDVLPGDEIASYDEATQKVVFRKLRGVVETGVQQLYEIVLEGNLALEVTAEHTCFVKVDGKGAWLKTAEIQVGDTMLVSRGESKTEWKNVLAVNKGEEEKVFDLEIEDTHNFFANDILAHNTLISDVLEVDSINATSASATSTFAHALNLTGQVAVGDRTYAPGNGANAFGHYNSASGFAASAFGYQNTASASRAVAVGSYNTASNTDSLAIGYDNTASGQFSTAAGYYNTASGLNSSAFGYNSQATSTASIAVGNQALAGGGVRASAFGYQSAAHGTDSTALGRSNEASGFSSSAFGYQNTASGYYSAAFGSGAPILGASNNTASGAYSSAFGVGNTSSGTGSSVFGLLSQATSTNSTAVGRGALAGGGTGASAFGHLSAAHGSNSTALGYSNEASGSGALAVGYNNTASGSFSSASGYNNQASGIESSAFGSQNTASGLYTSAFGYYNTATASYSSAFGFQSQATSTNSTAVGRGALAGSNTGASAFGVYSTAYGQNSVSVGYGNTASALNSQVFGRSNFTGSGGLASVQIGILNNSTGGTLNTTTGAITGSPAATSTIGRLSTAVGIENLTEGNFSTAVGYDNLALGIGSSVLGYDNTASGAFSSVFGYQNVGGYRALAFGFDNTASGLTSMAAGYQNDATGNYSSAVGFDNTASGVNSSAFGYSNVGGYQGSAFGYDNTASGNYSSAIGYESQATSTNSVAIGNQVLAGGGTGASAFGYLSAAHGQNSSALGYSNEASGNQSTAAGFDNTASGSYSTAAGYQNTASGSSSSVFGNANTATGNYASAAGYSNIASGNYTSVFGYNNTTLSNFSSAFGAYSQATSTNSTAIGYQVLAGGGTGASAFGYLSAAHGQNSSALGYSNEASGNLSTAVGYNNTSSAASSTAVGFGNTASALNSQVFGLSNFTGSGGGGSVQIGILNNAAGATIGGGGTIVGTPVAASTIGARSVAVGSDNLTPGDLGLAFGYSNNASSSQALAFGLDNNALSASASAFGFVNTASGNYASAFGANNTASGNYSSAFGFQNTASGENASAFGIYSQATSTNSVAVGRSALAGGGTGASAFGYLSAAHGQNSTAVGYLSEASGASSVAVGTGVLGLVDNVASGNNSSAFGFSNNASATNSSAVGYYNFAQGNYSSAFGYLSRATSTNSVAVGSQALAGGGTGASAFGYLSAAHGANSTALGRSNEASGSNSAAVGFSNTASAYGAVAFGYRSSASAYGATAVGSGNLAGGTVASGSHSSAFGFQSTASALNSQVFGRSNFTGSGGLASVQLGILNNSTGGTLNTTTGAITGSPAATSTIGRLSTAVGVENLSEGNQSSAVGSSNLASGVRSAAFGYNNTASGNSASAFGFGNTASGDYAASVGYDNSASGYYASAFGINNIASGANSSAFGMNNTASGDYSSASGYLNTASADSSSAFGFQSQATSTNSVAVGRSVLAGGGTGASAFGYLSAAHGTNSTALGYDNEASGNNSSAIGYQNTASGTYSSASGYRNNVGGYQASAFGFINTASADSSSAFGFQSQATSTNSTAVGRGALAGGANGASAFGYLSAAHGSNSTAAGYSNEASGSNSAAFGYDNTSSGAFSSAVGYSNEASATWASAFGYNNAASVARASALGHGNTASASYSSAFGHYTTASGSSSSAFGYNSRATSTNSTAVGRSVLAGSGTEASAFGYQSAAYGQGSVSVGHTNTAAALNSVTVGRSNFTASDGHASVQIGVLNNASGATLDFLTGAITGTPVATSSVGLLSTAVGIDNWTEGDYSTAIGYANTPSGENSTALGILNSASTNSASAVGYINEASGGIGASAFGYSNTALTGAASAFGYFNSASGSSASAFGYDNTASGNLSSAFGYDNTASGSQSTVVGYNNVASATGASVFGSSITNSTSNSTMIGPSDSAKVTILSTGETQANFFAATSGTATSTFAGGIDIENGGFVYDFSTNRVGIGTETLASRLGVDVGSQTVGIDVSGESNLFTSNDAYGIRMDANFNEFSGSPSLYGIYSAPGTTGDLFGNAANNYAFYGAPTGGTTDWGIYLTGEDRNYFSGDVGIGTTTPYANLAVSGDAVITDNVTSSYFTATSTTATSTFAGGVSIGDGVFEFEPNSGLASLQNVQLGALNLETDAGIVSWIDLPVSNTPSAGDVQSYTAQIDGTSLLTVYAEADGSGGIQNSGVGVGTTSPWKTFSVDGNVSLAGLGTLAATGDALCLTGENEVSVNSGTASCTVSSERFKNSIEELDVNAMELVLNIEPSSFVYNWSSTTQWGFIAEQLASTSPFLATYNASGTPHSIDQPAILSLVTKALQETIEQVNSLGITIVDGVTSFGQLVAQRVTTQELCVGETCITEEELKTILASAGTSSADVGGGGDDDPDSGSGTTGTTTDDGTDSSSGGGNDDTSTTTNDGVDDTPDLGDDDPDSGSGTTGTTTDDGTGDTDPVDGVEDSDPADSGGDDTSDTSNGDESDDTPEPADPEPPVEEEPEEEEPMEEPSETEEEA